MPRLSSSRPLPSRLIACDRRCQVRSLLVRPIFVTLQHSPTLRAIDSAYVSQSRPLPPSRRSAADVTLRSLPPSRRFRCRRHVTFAAAVTSRLLPPSRHVLCRRKVNIRCRHHVTFAAAITSRSLPPSRHVRCRRHVRSFVRVIRVTIPRSPSQHVIELYAASTSRYGASSCDTNHSSDNTLDCSV